MSTASFWRRRACHTTRAAAAATATRPAAIQGQTAGDGQRSLRLDVAQLRVALLQHRGDADRGRRGRDSLQAALAVGDGHLQRGRGKGAWLEQAGVDQRRGRFAAVAVGRGRGRRLGHHGKVAPDVRQRGQDHLVAGRMGQRQGQLDRVAHGELAVGALSVAVTGLSPCALAGPTASSSSAISKRA